MRRSTMKYARKLIALSLSWIMILSLLPATAFAKEILTDSSAYEISDTTQIPEYAYTAQEDGYYTFIVELTSSTSLNCGVLLVYDETGSTVSTSKTGSGLSKSFYTAWLNAGTEYKVQHIPFYTGNYTLSVKKETIIDLTDTATLNDVTAATTYYFNYTPTENTWYTFHATIPGSWDIKNHDVTSDYGHSTYLVDHIGSEETVAYLKQDVTYSFEYVPEEAGTTTISVGPANNLESITAGTTYSLSVMLDSYQYYVFSPEEEGNYMVKATPESADGSVYIFDDQGMRLANGVLRSSAEMSADLKAGKSYYLAYWAWAPTDLTVTRRSGLSLETDTSGYCGENLQWNYNTDTGLLTITGTGEMGDYNSQYEGAPWHNFTSNITDIQLPEGITSITYRAFANCTALSTVQLPTTLVSIGNYAYSGCTGLTDLAASEGVVSIAYSAFSDCSALQTVSLPSTLETIQEAAFWNDAQISQVTYNGTQAQWGDISIGSGNESLTSADMIFLDGTVEGFDFALEDLVKFVPYQGHLDADYRLAAGETLPTGLTLENQFITGVPQESGTFMVHLMDPNDVEKTLKLVISEPEDAPYRDKTDEGYEWINNPPTTITEGEDLILISKGEFNTFRDVYLDGVRLTRNVDYKAEPGSTKITIYSQTLSHVGSGKHVISAEFREGDTLKKATHTVEIKQNGSGGGGSSSGGSAVSNSYSLLVSPDIIHGTVALSKTSAAKGASITITVHPEERYTLDKLEARDSNGNLLSLKGSGNQYSFTMPGSSVTVYASFIRNGYAVNAASVDNGTVQLSTDRAEKDETVNVSLFPAGGCIAQGITVVDETGQQIEVHPNGTGYSFIMPGCSVTVHAQFIRVLPFLDVYADQWYWDQICYIYENKIMVGTSETLFQPEMVTTRGMVATTLYHMAGRPSASENTNFNDVAPESYYAVPVIWAYENQIAAGYGSGQFGPDDGVTREQLAVMLYRYANHSGLDTTVTSTALDKFSDKAEISSYAVQSMAWACGTGLLDGYGDGTLKPKGLLTRAELATVLMQFHELLH